MTPPKVMIGMPIGSGSLPWPTAVSLLSTVRTLDKEQIPFKIEAPTGCSIVQWARSTIAEAFLKSDFTHLFWIDSDIVWHPNDFIRLLGFGAKLDVVCATYPFKKDPPGCLVNFAVDENGAYDVLNDIGCIRVKSLGLGFTCVKRDVMRRVAVGKPRVKDRVNGVEYADIFRVDRANGGPRGEDVAFFADVRAQGFDVWLDPSINLGHIGQKTYRGDTITMLGLDAYAAKQEK